jgi:hypothetical protein
MRRYGLVALLCAALAGGCGDSGETQKPPTATTTTTSAASPEVDEPPAALPDPCALITKADAEKLASTPLQEAVPVRETCSYTGPVSGPTAQVEVYIGDGAKKMLDVDRDLAHTFTPLPGIGDEAHLEDGAVFFRKGVVWVAIRLVRLDDPAVFRKPLEDAARTAAGRM